MGHNVANVHRSDYIHATVTAQAWTRNSSCIPTGEQGRVVGDNVVDVPIYADNKMLFLAIWNWTMVATMKMLLVVSFQSCTSRQCYVGVICELLTTTWWM